MSENTIIDPEQNIYNANSGAVPPPIPPQEDPIITTPAPYAEKEEKEGMSKGAKIAAGVGLGIAAGAGIAVLSSADTPPEYVVPDEALEDPTAVPVADNVNDGMSFNEAFAAARAELGPGGVFMWHGRAYNTFYKEEWAKMTAEERANFTDGLTIDTTANGDQVAHIHHWDRHVNVQKVETVSVNVEKAGPDPDVQVLGVVHDQGTGVNTAGVLVDGQEVVLIDVDSDQVFDLMAIDVDQNGTIETSEQVDISGSNITVADLGGFTAINPGPMDDVAALSADDNVNFAFDAEAAEEEVVAEVDESAEVDEADFAATEDVTSDEDFGHIDEDFASNEDFGGIDDNPTPEPFDGAAYG